jgi:hypothetical protein
MFVLAARRAVTGEQLSTGYLQNVQMFLLNTKKEFYFFSSIVHGHN